jgi:hypothetical protein
MVVSSEAFAFVAVLSVVFSFLAFSCGPAALHTTYCHVCRQPGKVCPNLQTVLEVYSHCLALLGGLLQPLSGLPC